VKNYCAETSISTCYYLQTESEGELLGRTPKIAINSQHIYRSTKFSWCEKDWQQSGHDQTALEEGS
jgi:hypothetical protein